MKWRNHAALLEIGASPREVDATPSHSLFVSSSCFTLLILPSIYYPLPDRQTDELSLIG